MSLIREANVKPPKSTPESRKAERQARDRNPLKPTYTKRQKIGEQEAIVTAKVQDHTDYQVAGSSLHSISRKKLAELEAGGKRISSTFRPKPGKRKLERVRKVRGKVVRSLTQRTGLKVPRQPLRKVSRSESAKERRRLDAAWREQIHAIWGSCIVTGETRPGHVHAHHCYDKSYAPQWRHEPWNGILLEAYTIHPLADTYPEFHKALCEVADECRAAAEGRRPPVSRREAREIIFRKAPKVRKYARSEE